MPALNLKVLDLNYSAWGNVTICEEKDCLKEKHLYVVGCSVPFEIMIDTQHWLIRFEYIDIFSWINKRIPSQQGKYFTFQGKVFTANDEGTSCQIKMRNSEDLDLLP